MNPFEKHGIKHLSPSSLNLYAANPCLWVGRYLKAWTDEFGPAAQRGTAVETGLDVWLYQRDAKLAEVTALENFAFHTQGQADQEYEDERANIAPMLAQAIIALKDAPIPIARQLKLEHFANGVEVPIMGFLDYIFEDYGLDLKTTKACPSSIKADHGRQVAMYSAAKGKPWKVLYVTPKKFALHVLTAEDADVHLRDLERQARAVRHLLNRSIDADDAARFFAPERSDFRWSPKLLELAEGVA